MTDDITQRVSERTILKLLRAGDEAGLQWIVQRYTPYVSSIVWSIIGQRLTLEDAEEVIADVFLTLWRYREKPKPGKLKSYLGAIARTRSISRLKSAGTEITLEYDDLEIPVDGPENEVIRSEQKEALRQHLESMKPQDREIFLRYYYFCESAPTIAERLNMSAEAVRQRLSRGRIFLRQRLEKGKAQ